MCRDKANPLETRLKNCKAMIGIGRGRRFDQGMRMTVAAIYAQTGDYADAVATLDQVVEQDSDNAFALNNRCWARAMLGTDLASARADCDAARQLDRHDTAFLDSAGMVEFKAGNLDAAAADYDKALEANAKAAPSLFMRGVVKHRKGDIAGGDADIAAAEALDGKIAATYAGYGITP